MSIYGSLADDWYINMNLNTEMKLPDSRETLLGFFERVQKSYPEMSNFYTRPNGDLVLEEEKDEPSRRWLHLEDSCISSGRINPVDPDDAFGQHQTVLELVPYMLSVSPLDCEALDYVMGFDFDYRGNHDELVAEALSLGPSFDGMLEIPDSKVLHFSPSMTIALDENCRRWARLLIETRSTPYQVRRGNYSEDQISVYFTVRQYGSLSVGSSFENELAELRETCEELLNRSVIEQVLRPLAQAISTR